MSADLQRQLDQARSDAKRWERDYHRAVEPWKRIVRHERDRRAKAEIERDVLRALLAEHPPTAPAVDEVRALAEVDAERDMFRDKAHRAIKALGSYDRMLGQVQALHTEQPGRGWAAARGHYDLAHCSNCNVPWPCATIRILDGGGGS